MAIALIIAGAIMAALGLIGGMTRPGIDGAQAIAFGVVLGLLLAGAGAGVLLLGGLQ